MENESSKNADIKSQSNNRVKKSIPYKKIVSTTIYIIGVLGFVAGGYFGYKYVKNVKNEVSENDKSIAGINEKLKSIEDVVNYSTSRIDTLATAQVNTTQNTYTITAPSYANVTVEKVTEDKNAALEDGFRFLLLDVKLENKTNNEIYYSTGELKLKDSDNYEYLYFGQGQPIDNFVKKDAKVSLPNNRIPISFASLKPGETVKGTVVYVLNRPNNKFSLIRNGELIKSISL